MSNRSYSYSQISAAYKCNRLYKLLYIDKLESTQEPSGDMEFGTAMHMAIQEVLEGGVGNSFKAYWSSLDPSKYAWGRYGHKELSDQGERLIERFRRLHAKRYKVKEMETRLFDTSLSINVEGTPDFIGEFDGICSVVDFKTSGYAYSKEKILCSDQLMLYAYLAMAKGHNVSQLAYIVFVKGVEPRIQVLTHTFTGRELAQRIANIESICEELDTKEVFHANYNSCLIGTIKCPMFGVCHVTKRED